MGLNVGFTTRFGCVKKTLPIESYVEGRFYFLTTSFCNMKEKAGIYTASYATGLQTCLQAEARSEQIGRRPLQRPTRPWL